MIENCLAAWRLAHLLVEEDGPCAVFARLRYAAGLRVVVTKGENGPQPARVAANTLAEGLTCIWCVSMWTAGLLVLGERFRSVRSLRRVLAVSAGACALQEGIAWLRSRT